MLITFKKMTKTTFIYTKAIKLTKGQLYIKVMGQGCEVFIIHLLYTMLVKVR
jgi:hypothetical protein